MLKENSFVVRADEEQVHEPRADLEDSRVEEEDRLEVQDLHVHVQVHDPDVLRVRLVQVLAVESLLVLVDPGDLVPELAPQARVVPAHPLGVPFAAEEPGEGQEVGVDVNEVPDVPAVLHDVLPVAVNLVHGDSLVDESPLDVAQVQREVLGLGRRVGVQPDVDVAVELLDQVFTHCDRACPGLGQDLLAGDEAGAQLVAVCVVLDLARLQGLPGDQAARLAVEEPAVEGALHAGAVLHLPSDPEVRPAVGAERVQGVGFPGLAPEEDEVVAGLFYGNRFSGLDV